MDDCGLRRGRLRVPRGNPIFRGHLMAKIHPVILSGGSGTRLWPLSRTMYPKQFIRFFDGEGPTFLGATLRRLSPEAGFAAPKVICNNNHRFLVREELAQ